MVRHCHFVVYSCWNLGYCMIDYIVMLVLEHFWSVYLLSWCNLDNVGGFWNFHNVGSLWCCWMNFGLDFGSIGIVKKLCCGLAWICSWYMWKSLLACVNLVLWTWQNFFGVCMDKFVGMDKFCGHETLTYVKNFVGYVMLVHGKFLWLWFWLCENLLVVHGHVGNYLLAILVM